MATQLELLPQKIRSLGYQSYGDYLKSEHWQQFRKRFFRESKRSKRMYKKYGRPVCEFCLLECLVTNEPLSLHHQTYKRIGEERLGDVVLICFPCHRTIHKRRQRNLWNVTKNVSREKRRIGNKKRAVKRKHEYLYKEEYQQQMEFLRSI